MKKIGPKFDKRSNIDLKVKLSVIKYFRMNFGQWRWHFHHRRSGLTFLSIFFFEFSHIFLSNFENFSWKNSIKTCTPGYNLFFWHQSDRDRKKNHLAAGFVPTTALCFSCPQNVSYTLKKKSCVCLIQQGVCKNQDYGLSRLLAVSNVGKITTFLILLFNWPVLIVPYIISFSPNNVDIAALLSRRLASSKNGLLTFWFLEDKKKQQHFLPDLRLVAHRLTLI